MFGEVDIIFKRKNRLDSYKARGDCYVLKIDRAYFLQIVGEFEDIRQDVHKMVFEREFKRLELI